MRKSIVATAVAAFAVTGIALAVPASAAPKDDPGGGIGPLHAACGTPGPNRENRVHPDAPSNGAANQRNGTRAVSLNDCPILGVLQPTDDALYFCWTRGTDGFTWTYLRNQRTGVRGWVRDMLLDGNGSNSPCGF